MTTRRQLLVVAVALPLLGACGTGGKEQTTAATLGVDDFASRIAESGVVLLDVRTPAEYTSGHLANARNIDAESGDFTSQVESLDKGGRYALYCRSGRRSAVAMEAMIAAGFTDVAHLDGGIGAWQAAGKPVTR